MPRLVSLAVVVVALALALAGCGSSSDGGSSDSSAGDTGSTTITLPDGWTMTDALSAEEVGAVTGQAMEVFPEASSAAQDGRPKGSYIATGVDGSKVYFSVDVQGGEAGFESELSFAEPDSATEVSGVGDQARVVTFSDGRAGIIARRGDAVIRIDWDPQVYAQDPTDFGTQLANALLQNMYE